MSRTISGTNGSIVPDPATDNPTYVIGTISTSTNADFALYAPSGASCTVTNVGLILNLPRAARDE